MNYRKICLLNKVRISEDRIRTAVKYDDSKIWTLEGPNIFFGYFLRIVLGTRLTKGISNNELHENVVGYKFLGLY